MLVNGWSLLPLVAFIFSLGFGLGWLMGWLSDGNPWAGAAFIVAWGITFGLMFAVRARGGITH